MPEPLPPLAPPSKLRSTGYAAGNFGKNILWSAADLTLLFLMTDVVGIDPGVAGAAILASLLVNALLDPVMGGVADRVRGPLGRSGPLMLVGAPLCAASFAAIYALPVLGVTSVAVTLVALILFRASFAIVDAPHNALLARLATTSQTRAWLSGLRFAFSSVATLAVILILPSLFAARDGGGAATLATVTSSIAAVSALAIMLAALASRPWDLPQANWAFASDVMQNRSIRLLDRPIILLLTMILVVNALVPLFGKMIVYHATYVVGDADRARVMLVTMVVGQLAGVIPWIMLVHQTSARNAIGCAMAVTAVAAGLMAGSAGLSAPSDMGIALIFGFGAGGIYALIWLLVADAADGFQRESGIAAPALIFGLAIVAIKAGQGVGALLTGTVLDAAGYVPRTSVGADIGWAITALQAVGPLVGLGISGALLIILKPSHTVK